MAEQVNIASLSIDVDDVLKDSIELKKSMDALKKSQKELKKSGDDTGEQFVKQEAELKNLSKSYRDNQQFASALGAANKDLTKTMQVEGKSTQELYDSRSQLQKIAKNIKGNTQEEIELRDRLNSTIDEQTEGLRGQGSVFNSSKDKIGEYTDGINRSDLSVEGLIMKTNEAGSATKLFSNTAKAAVSGLKAMTKAALKFIATPIGLVLGVIAAAFLLIKNAMNRSETSTNKIKKAFAGFSGILKGVMKLLKPIGDFLIDGIVKGFELVEKVVTKTLNLLQRALERLGFEKAAAGMAEFNAKVEEASEASKKLMQAEIDLQKAQRNARLIQLQYQKDAEKLRQIRDDETKSFKERIKANEDLGKVLKKQSEEELEIARKALEVAELKIKLDGDSTANLDARAEALIEIADIEERITGQESEQLVNRVSLQREATDAIKELKDQEAAKAQEVAKLKMEAAKEAAESAVAWAEFELNQYVRANQSKLASDKFLSEEAVKAEEQRLQEVADKRAAFAVKQLTEGTIKEVEYNEAIAGIQQEYSDNLETLRKERSAAEKERVAIDAENSLQLLEEGLISAFEIEGLSLDRNRELEVAAAEKSGADVEVINEKYNQRKVQLESEVADAKIAGFGQVLDSYASILGEETKAGKAAAIASALISTYQGAQSAYTSLAGIPVVGVGLGIAAAGAAIVAGLKRVGKIRNTSEKFSKGDILSGRSHAAGGIPFSIGGRLGYEAEGGESIINKRSTAMFRPILSAMNAAGGGKRFAGGGIAGQGSRLPSSLLIDYDLLASRIAQANENLPNPVVSVEEINKINNNVSVIEGLATA